MAAEIIDGKQIADKIREELTSQIKELKTNRGLSPGLSVVLVGENPASKVQEEYFMFDIDRNGVISVDEVYDAIDRFFEGGLNVSAGYITELVDYFFEQ